MPVWESECWNHNISMYFLTILILYSRFHLIEITEFTIHVSWNYWSRVWDFHLFEITKCRFVLPGRHWPHIQDLQNNQTDLQDFLVRVLSNKLDMFNFPNFEISKHNICRKRFGISPVCLLFNCCFFCWKNLRTESNARTRWWPEAHAAWRLASPGSV